LEHTMHYIFMYIELRLLCQCSRPHAWILPKQWLLSYRRQEFLVEINTNSKRFTFVPWQRHGTKLPCFRKCKDPTFSVASCIGSVYISHNQHSRIVSIFLNYALYCIAKLRHFFYLFQITTFSSKIVISVVVDVGCLFQISAYLVKWVAL